MKRKILSLLFLATVVTVSLIAYSTHAQKKEGFENANAAAKINDDLMREVRKNVVCSLFYQNMTTKETEQWSIKGAKCNEASNFGDVVIGKGKRELRVSIMDFKTPEQAKQALRAGVGPQGFRPYDEFGDEGHKDLANISLVKGRLYVNVFFTNFDSDKIPKRFAEYALKAIESQ